ncbi:THAP domain-containing protein 6 isoform X1 [Globicephala melas]|uniref:THAP domain-containing protein 6 isoform X1 n=2 Tax=Globicephala melas TaxID=9731 RepID=UPI00293D7FEC|nr:THAP domain-containing protein 6 isoform X1 [Globicephala melas]XP_060155465.1 THAP domain-containing protein 6 isoform X1 [Globicephala melas]
MVKCCSAVGCASRCLPNSKLKGLTFHVFPTDENVKRKWVLAMKRLDVNAVDIWEPKKGDVLCSRHFKKTDFDRSTPNIKLKPGVIPSIFDSPSHSQYTGLSLLWALPLRSTGSERAGSAAMAHGPSRSAACGILLDRGTNPCPLHQQGKRENLHCRKNFTLKALPVTNHNHQLVGASSCIEEFQSQFIFEHSYSVMDSPKKLKHKLDQVISELEDTKKSLRNVLGRERRLQKSLRKTIRELKDECLISKETANRLDAFSWEWCQESIEQDYIS